MTDLYPDVSWNFVFGEASPRDRVGVYSFGRYDPRFFGQPPAAESHELMLRRGCKVLAHVHKLQWSVGLDVIDRYPG